MNRLQADIVLAALFALILSACGTLSNKTGQRDDSAQLGGTVGATPREQPPSRYGNPETYEVFGREYRVQTSSYGYRQRGTASWYGPNFHGKRTSSGKAYDMHQMTAAHKTLPIPTFVQVTRLDTGRKIIVKVNDRGPFVDDRLIDLSYAAAQQLDMLGPGTAPVEVKALPPYQYLARHQGPRPQERAPVALAQIEPPATAATAARLAGTAQQDTQVSTPANSTQWNSEPTPASAGMGSSERAAQTAPAPRSSIAEASVPAAVEPLLLLPGGNTPEIGYAVSTRTVDSAALPGRGVSSVYLQAGAFTQKSSAERLRSSLSQFLAWRVLVDSATDAMHRVRVGPLSDPQDIIDVKVVLAQLGIQNAYLVTQTEGSN